MSDSLKYSKVVTSLEFVLTNAEKLEKGNLIAQPPQWTTDPPTEAGHYWCFRCEAVSVCELILDEGVLWLTAPGYIDVPLKKALVSHWMRIETPESPK